MYMHPNSYPCFITAIKHVLTSTICLSITYTTVILKNELVDVSLNNNVLRLVVNTVFFLSQHS